MRRYVAIGATAVALTYFLDPENGRRRRREFRAWLNQAAQRIRERMVAAPHETRVETVQSRRPPVHEERPARVEERPARVEERPARAEERPARVEAPLTEPEPVAVSVAAAPEPEEAPRPVTVAERPLADAPLPPPLPPDVLDTRMPEVTIEEPAPAAPARRKRRGWLFGAVLLVAALAAAGLATWSFDLVGSSDDEPDSAARSLNALTERQARAISIMAQPGATRIPVAGAEESLLLVVGMEGDAVLIVSRLKRAPAGKTYEIWVISGNTPRPAGLFRGGRDTVVPLQRAVPKGATVALTLERLGGAPRPTSQPMYAVTRN